SKSEMSFYHTSYRSEAIRNAILLHIGYLPIYFLAILVRRNSQIYVNYKNTIIFSGVVQFFVSLPYTLFYSWFAIFVNDEIETTELVCTMARMGLSILNYVSYNALTVRQEKAISISRVLSVVFDHPCDLKRNLLFFSLPCLPILGLFAKAVASGTSRENPVCGPLLFFDNTQQIAWAWNLYIFAIPLIAVVLNSITACYLIKHRIGRLSSGSETKRVNELHVALALLLQSLVPAITMSSKGYRSIVEIYAVKSPWWLKEPVDILSFLTTGLNMVISMMCIRSFRE
ncbi:hypothetical protein PFISCL1PPCAC_14395, partial [Pristionchus fissidentatus]